LTPIIDRRPVAAVAFVGVGAADGELLAPIQLALVELAAEEPALARMHGFRDRVALGSVSGHEGDWVTDASVTYRRRMARAKAARLCAGSCDRRLAHGCERSYAQCMWVVRQLARLLVGIALAFAIAFLLALFMHAKLESFAHCLLISCIAVGAVLIMAAVPTSSAGEGRRDYGVMASAWERVPGLSIFSGTPTTPA
jgi:hypothetical protein